MSMYTKLMIVITALFLVSVWILSLVKIVLHLIVAPLFSLRCCTISGFGVLFMNEDGKWKCKKDKFSPLIQDMVIVDITKPVPDDIDKKDWQYMLVCNTVELVIAISAFWILKDQIRALMQWNDASAAELFLGALGYGLVLNGATHFILNFYSREIY